MSSVPCPLQHCNRNGSIQGRQGHLHCVREWQSALAAKRRPTVTSPLLFTCEPLPSQGHPSCCPHCDLPLLFSCPSPPCLQAKRTPIGTFLGKLKNFSATDLAVVSSKAAIAEAKIDPKVIDSSIFGNVAQTSTDAAYLARHVALKAGMRVDSTALTLNRLCGSGFQSVISAAHEIQSGEAHVVLAGGGCGGQLWGG